MGILFENLCIRDLRIYTDYLDGTVSSIYGDIPTYEAFEKLGNLSMLTPSASRRDVRCDFAFISHNL